MNCDRTGNLVTCYPGKLFVSKYLQQFCCFHGLCVTHFRGEAERKGRNNNPVSSYSGCKRM
jgi:hypothetical protein